MSTITHLPTVSLREGDTLLVGASAVIVDAVEPDSTDDGAYWLTATCVSGDFEQWETPHRATRDATWQVLNAEAR